MVIGETWLYGLIAALIGLLFYFLKYNFEAILNEIKQQKQDRADCRESLPLRFADKIETKESFDRIAGQLCSHDHRIINIENKISNRDIRDIRSL